MSTIQGAASTAKAFDPFGDGGGRKLQNSYAESATETCFIL